MLTSDNLQSGQSIIKVFFISHEFVADPPRPTNRMQEKGRENGAGCFIR